MKTKTHESYGEKMARLRAKVEQFSEEYDDETRAEMMQRIRGYSDRNVMLILSQMPEAFDVRGHHEWEKDNRIVAHGQHGIEILAPAGKRDGEKHEDGTQDKEQRFFRVAYVFDYSQTEPTSEHRNCEMCKRRRAPWTQS